MNYSEILKQIAKKENISTQQIENEMKTALEMAGLNCSVSEFIETASCLIREKTIYRR